MGEDDSSIISLEKVIADLDTTNEYFLNIFKSKGLEVATLRLRKGEPRGFRDKTFRKWTR
jgi:hypothetical protein